MPRKKVIREVAVIDLETDPFEYGRRPEPFVAGYYDKDGFKYFWGDDCIKQLVEFLIDQPKNLLIYAHNGGKFDYFYFLDYLENPLKIINGRIAKCKLDRHELRDSYSIIPIPLSAYKKDEIDYKLMERAKREKHKTEIIKYLEGDCKYLHELVLKFRERFGDNLTVGGTAIKQLKQFHPVEHTTESFDKEFRPFYYGGRVECFDKGIFKGQFNVYDVNSMYPYVMREYDHPNSGEFWDLGAWQIDKNGELKDFEGTYFAIIEAESEGALPLRTDNGLSFPRGTHIFYATSHEIKVALKYKKLKIKKVINVLLFSDVTKYNYFVDTFSKEKIDSKKSGNKVGELFAKFMLNSAYGKFGTNPANFFDWAIVRPDEYPPEDYELYEANESFELWRIPAKVMRYYNVATAASITGAARATLFNALCQLEKPLYCDTDSIITEGELNGVPMHDSDLGAWKFEGSGDKLGLAGKKLYALNKGRENIKIASKGAKLNEKDIFDLCKGKIVEWESIAPNFKIDGKTKFVKRKLQKR